MSPAAPTPVGKVAEGGRGWSSSKRGARCLLCGEEWERDPALEVPCPSCKARVGVWCKRPSGHKAMDLHAPRLERAHDAGKEHTCPGAILDGDRFRRVDTGGIYEVVTWEPGRGFRLRSGRAVQRGVGLLELIDPAGAWRRLHRLPPGETARGTCTLCGRVALASGECPGPWRRRAAPSPPATSLAALVQLAALAPRRPRLDALARLSAHTAAGKGREWPEDTHGILMLIQAHQGTGKKWGANHEGLPRATIDRLVNEQLVQEVFMSGEPVTAKKPRKHFPTLLVTTEAGDAFVASGKGEHQGPRVPVPSAPIVVVTIADDTEVLGEVLYPGKDPAVLAYKQADAEAKARALGEGWEPIRLGRRWYVRRLPRAASPAEEDVPVDALAKLAAFAPPRPRVDALPAQRHATMEENAARWARDVSSALAQMTAAERARFYETHAQEALATAMRAAALNKVPEADTERVAREGLASSPVLRPFLDVLGTTGATEKPIVLIACSNTKVDTHGQSVPAADLYASPLFRKSLAYARAITSEGNIRILSALHGVLRTTDKIATYDYPMSKLRKSERSAWAESARERLISAFGRDRPHTVVLLAGSNYHVALPWPMALPLGGKSIGKSLQWLNEELRALGASETPAPEVAAPRPGRIRMDLRGRPWREVEALAWDGDLFVHEDVIHPDLFRVTHAPSGRAWTDPFSDVAAAEAAAAKLNDPAVRPTFDRLVEAVKKKGPQEGKVPWLLAELRQHLATRATAAADAPPSSQLVVGPASERSA